MDPEQNFSFISKLELLLIGGSADLLSRSADMVSNYNFNFKHARQFDFLIVEAEYSLRRVEVVVLFQEQNETINDFTLRIENSLRLFPRSRLITVLKNGFTESLDNFRHPRIFPLTYLEYSFTIKFEFLCLYFCRCQYVLFDIRELFPMTQLTFSVFVWLNKNQRFLAAAFENVVLSDLRHQRLSDKKIFLRLSDANKYSNYIKSYFDMSGKALKKRAKAAFLSVCLHTFSLYESILLHCKPPSHNSLVATLYSLRQIAEELFEIIRLREDLWDVFFYALDNKFTPICRAPWIAVYGALISIKSGLGDPFITLMSGLLADVGLYDLKREIVEAYLLTEDKVLVENNLNEFKNHPLISLNLCLSLKIPIDDSVKSILVSTHEQFDRNGFPKKISAASIPVESQILMFSEKIDQGHFLIKSSRIDFFTFRAKVLEKELNGQSNFDKNFLLKIAEAVK
ncbi:MAG: HD domain-containing phosphohydrolase [Bdellovibrio sp.]